MDRNGQERAGTKTPPGTTPTNCDDPSKEHNLDSVHLYVLREYMWVYADYVIMV